MSRSAQGFAKVKDIRPGRVLYQVFCNSETASDIITTLIITGKPKLSGIVTNSYFFDCKEYNTRNNYSSIWLKHNYSIKDRNVGVHDSDSYNLHHLFTSKKAAQKFIDRVNKGCLSFHEQKLLIRLAEYNEENDHWSVSSLFCDDFSGDTVIPNNCKKLIKGYNIKNSFKDTSFYFTKYREDIHN